MSNVVKFPGLFNYCLDADGNFCGVYWKSPEDDIVQIDLDGAISVNCDRIPPKHLSRLMIMWLALHDPSVVNYDEVI